MRSPPLRSSSMCTRMPLHIWLHSYTSLSRSMVRVHSRVDLSSRPHHHLVVLWREEERGGSPARALS
jgi:hypothetical protein